MGQDRRSRLHRRRHLTRQFGNFAPQAFSASRGDSFLSAQEYGRISQKVLERGVADRLETERPRSINVRFIVVDEHALRRLDPHLFKGVSKGLGVRLFCADFGRVDDFLEKAGNTEFMFENALDPGAVIGKDEVLPPEGSAIRRSCPRSSLGRSP